MLGLASLSLLAWSAAPFNIGAAGRARFVQGLWVSGDFFTVRKARTGTPLDPCR